MTKHWFREPERDPELAEALRRVEARGMAAGRAAGDEEALRARIVAAAYPQLLALRRAGREPARPWWEWMAAFSRAAIPVGLAASLAAAAVLVQERASLDVVAVSADTVAAGRLLLGAADPEAEAGRVQYVDQLLAPVDGDWLLSEAMSR